MQSSWTPPPGWFPDPARAGTVRWWDGHNWTHHLAPAPHTGPTEAEKWLLPVGRSGWAIAAGYLGLFSLLGVFAPFSIAASSIALWHLGKRPDLIGRGRAIFGLVMGILGTLLLIAAIVAQTRSN